MNKTTFTTGSGTQDILLNGKIIGTIGSGSEVWVSINGESIARFKYRSPKAAVEAKDLVAKLVGTLRAQANKETA